MGHLIAERRLRGPDTADDENEHCCQVPPECRAARYVVWPADDGNGEADYQGQPEVDAERGTCRVLPLTLATFGVPLLAYLGGAGFWRKTIEFPLDLPQLDRPIDLTQRSLLSEGLVGLSFD